LAMPVSSPAPAARVPLVTSHVVRHMSWRGANSCGHRGVRNSVPSTAASAPGLAHICLYSPTFEPGIHICAGTRPHLSGIRPQYARFARIFVGLHSACTLAESGGPSSSGVLLKVDGGTLCMYGMPHHASC
jgi:hypothetical protein